MIFIGGTPFSTHSSSSSQENDTLFALMENPILVSTAQSLKAIPERRFTVSEECKSERSTQSRYVYLFQREYATVNPQLVDLVGTDEATTCVGLVIRNRRTGMTSVAHMDAPKVVDIGLTQMLSLVVDHDVNEELDVHLIGGFDDSSPKNSKRNITSGCTSKFQGYSYPLCTKIVESLRKRQEKFHIQTLFILGHNTKMDYEGNMHPLFAGLLVETSTGMVFPATFDRTTRGPDEIVRRIRVTASFEDPSWCGKLLDTYDTVTDKFKIAPCSWTLYQLRVASELEKLSDSDILLTCSTSPYAEAPDFVENLRRQWNYLIQHPRWRETFPMRQPRVFERTAGGGWIRC